MTIRTELMELIAARLATAADLGDIDYWLDSSIDCESDTTTFRDPVSTLTSANTETTHTVIVEMRSYVHAADLGHAMNRRLGLIVSVLRKPLVHDARPLMQIKETRCEASGEGNQIGLAFVSMEVKYRSAIGEI